MHHEFTFACWGFVSPTKLLFFNALNYFVTIQSEADIACKSTFGMEKSTVCAVDSSVVWAK